MNSLLLILVVTFLLDSSFSTPTSGRFKYIGPEQIHLSYTGNQSSMYVTWTTIVYYGKGSVSYNASDNNEALSTVDASVTEVTHYSEDNSEVYRVNFVFRATLVGLKPNTFYEYVVQNGYFKSDKFMFKTFPLDQDFLPTIAVYGDLGVENHISLDKLVQDAKEHVYDVVWHVGDFAYDMNELLGARGDLFMNLIQPIASTVPYSVIPGNHETADNFSEYRNKFTSPPPNVFFHSYNIGPIHLVMFNTEFYYTDYYGTAQLQSQYNWLVDDLEKANAKEAREKQPWIIAVGHRPMYCSSRHYGDCRPDNYIRTGYKNEYFNLEDLFYENGVDLQFYGHMHNYERMYPVYNFEYEKVPDASQYHNPKYPVHVISGSAGNREIHPGFWFPEPKWSYFRKNDYGFGYLKVVDRLTLKFSQYSVQKAHYIDEFVISKSQNYPTFPSK